MVRLAGWARGLDFGGSSFQKKDSGRLPDSKERRPGTFLGVSSRINNKAEFPELLVVVQVILLRP